MSKPTKGADDNAPTNSNYPTVLAYSVPSNRRIPKRDFRKSWLVMCGQCGGVHAHGQGEGPRENHCPGGSEYPGYALKYAGPLPADLWPVAKKMSARPPKRLPSLSKRPSKLGLMLDEWEAEEKKRGGN